MDKFDTKEIGRWLFLIGLAVAAVFSVLDTDPLDWLPQVLVAMAILAGIFYADHSNAVNIGLNWLVLALALSFADQYMYEMGGGLPEFIKISDDPAFLGGYIMDILNAVVGFMVPYVITVLVMQFYNEHFGKQ